MASLVLHGFAVSSEYLVANAIHTYIALKSYEVAMFRWLFKNISFSGDMHSLISIDVAIIHYVVVKTKLLFVCWVFSCIFVVCRFFFIFLFLNQHFRKILSEIPAVPLNFESRSDPTILGPDPGPNCLQSI